MEQRVTPSTFVGSLMFVAGFIALANSFWFLFTTMLSSAFKGVEATESMNLVSVCQHLMTLVVFLALALLVLLIFYLKIKEADKLTYLYEEEFLDGLEPKQIMTCCFCDNWKELLNENEHHNDAGND